MGMSWAYGPRDESEAIATIHEAIDLGLNFLDTAEVYGPFENEKLVGRAIKGRRDRVVVATKFGFRIDVEGKTAGVDSRPEHIREVVEASLKRLDIDCIDLLYQHRVDPNVPIEEVVGTMSEFVRAGKVKYLGLSEASPRTLRRAHAVHPMSALQSEYSLFEREVEAEVLPACRELGIGFVAYSPLGRGLLTSKPQSAEQLSLDDFRHRFPRFQGENFERNRGLVESISAFARARGASATQLALAWLLHQADDIVPIPGTKRRTFLRENLSAAEVHLTAADLAWLNERFPPNTAAGPRYHEGGMQMLDRT
jgi:aryl-alcohol dehydrogenase-like predicted oxidoreductase